MSWNFLCPVSFLLIPIRYRFILEIKHLAVTVEFIFGLYKKTMELPGKKRERTADADEKIEEFLLRMRSGLLLPRGQK